MIPSEEEPLSQGDIRRGLAFATTALDGTLTADADARYVMVVSRPCKAVRDPFVTVVPVHQSKLDLSEVRQKLEANAKRDGERVSLDRMRRFLAGHREGGQFTDSFYLGTLETGSPKRFAADLSALSTVQVPKEEDARAQWVKKHRVARLDVDFARDLHVRLFNTIARLGFDDHGWYADADLAIMITEGKKQLQEAELAFTEAEQAVQQKEAKGETVAKGLRENLEGRRAEVVTATKELQPYVDEQARRAARA